MVCTGALVFVNYKFIYLNKNDLLYISQVSNRSPGFRVFPSLRDRAQWAVSLKPNRDSGDSPSLLGLSQGELLLRHDILRASLRPQKG